MENATAHAEGCKCLFCAFLLEKDYYNTFEKNPRPARRVTVDGRSYYGLFLRPAPGHEATEEIS